MQNGYNGKIIRADLTKGEISYEQLDPDILKKYIGGAGLAAKIVWDETTADTDPLSPESPLIFMTGPLTGSRVPMSGRHAVCGLSPLTGIWGQAHSGGNWADEIRHAGFEGIVITGKSEKPVYIWIYAGKAEIRDAGHLWGKDTYEVAELIKAETDERASTACIGRAGERLVKIAAVMNDGKAGRAAARCGLGALMGSKNLKAVVTKGTLPISYHDEDKLKEHVKKILTDRPPVRDQQEIMKKYPPFFEKFIEFGMTPVKNWTEGKFKEGIVYPEHSGKGKPLYCKRCPWSCSESTQSEDGERQMCLEAWGPIATNSKVANAEAMQKAYTLCNKYGLDSISTGGVIAFGLECFEKGLITTDDTGGMELKWGDADVMVELVRQIGEREGIGALLGEGVKKAAEKIGGTAIEYAIHSKGLEFANHDPRQTSGYALTYATANIGACHTDAPGSFHLENVTERDPAPFTSVDLGFPVALKRFEYDRRAELVAKTQDLGGMINSLIVCLYMTMNAETWTQPSGYVELLNAATGFNMSQEEFMLAGERMFNLKRMINVRRGISRKDDTLPPRILTSRLKEGWTKGNVPNLGAMLYDYYLYRGWSEEGIPTREKLTQLGLDECLNY